MTLSHRLRRYSQKAFMGFLLLIVLHLLWAALSAAIKLPLLPFPLKVYAHWPDLWVLNDVPTHMGVSLMRLLSAIGVALFLSLALTLAYAFRNRGRTVVDSFLYFSYPVPKLLLLPIIMVLLGLGNIAKITLVVLVIAFQMMVTLRDALKDIPTAYWDVMRTYRSGVWAIIKHLLLPALQPAIFSSLRVAIGTALSVLFVAETYGTDRGIGFLITDLWNRLDYVGMYGAIVMLSALGLLMFLLVDWTERLLSPHKR